MDIISRKQAKLQELKRYYTGKPCKYGHTTERFMNGACVECNRIHGKNYIEQNPEKCKANHRKTSTRWVRLNPEKRKASRKRYYNSEKYHSNSAKNKEIAQASFKRYRTKYPERRAALSMKRRANKLQAIPLWYERDLVDQLYLKRKELSKLWGIQLHVDHIIPLQSKTVCGLHCWDNLQLLEASLNISKSNSF